MSDYLPQTPQEVIGYLSAIVVAFVAGFGAARIHYTERLAALKARVDARDEELRRYTEPLTPQVADAMSNVVLRRRAIGLARAIRTLDSEQRRVDQQASTIDDQATIDAPRESPERMRAWTESQQRAAERRERAAHEFAQRFGTDAVLLKDVLVRRLPKPLPFLRPASIDARYDHAAHYGWRMEVADDLEKLAKCLPDT